MKGHGAGTARRFGYLFVSGMALWLLLTAAAGSVVAQDGTCRVFVDGTDIEQAGDPSSPILLPIDGAVPLTAEATAEINDFDLHLYFGPFQITQLSPTAAPMTREWSGTIRVGEYATYGAGLYRVAGQIDGCAVGGWVKIDSPSPLTTVASLAAFAALAVGSVAAGTGLLSALRHRGGLVRSVIGGALVGGSALVLAQQTGNAPADTGNIVSWTAVPGAAGGLGHVMLGAVVSPRARRRPTSGERGPGSSPRARTDMDDLPRSHPNPALRRPRTSTPIDDFPSVAHEPASPDTMAPAEQVQEREIGQATAPEEPAVVTRFTVVNVFETETEAFAATRQLASFEQLEVGRWYALDLSIDVTASGIEREGEGRPIEEPGESGDIRISALATSADFEIDQPVRTLTLPPTGRSRDHAVFHIRRGTPTDEPAEVRIQLLYRLNLIEDILFVARVATGAADQPAPGSLRIRHAPIQQFAGLDALPPKQMHIHVSRRNEQYVFFFVVEVENERLEFNGRAPARLTDDTLESNLEASRRALLRIALSHRSSADADPPASRPTDPAEKLALATAGRKLWTELFLANKSAAMFDIGKWLADRNLDAGSLIQVTVDESAGNFVFPWGLLYDRPLPKRPFDPVESDGFWGLRYVIEQHVPPVRHRDQVEADFRASPRTKIESGPDFRAAVLLGNFPEASDQEAFFTNLATAGLISFDGGRALRSATDALALLGDCDSDLISFFTHGHTARQQSSARSGVDVDDFLSLYGAISPEALDPRWRGTYDRVKAGEFAAEDSWIELEAGRITLQDLAELSNRFKRSPVVMLNMCESVQLTPSLASSFVDYLMQMGAMTVIGTETSVTPPFAHQFGLRFLTAFLGGSPVGTALLDARQAYAAADDLFGLAYSLYGSGRVVLDPPVITMA